jgi:hypothetical protein
MRMKKKSRTAAFRLILDGDAVIVITICSSDGK